MSLEKPNAGKLVQQLLRALLLCRILKTNKGTNRGLPNREIPVDVPLSPKTENMVDPAENEETTGAYIVTASSFSVAVSLYLIC